MVQGNLIGVAVDGVTDLGDEPLPFSTLNPSKLLPILVATELVLFHLAIIAATTPK